MWTGTTAVRTWHWFGTGTDALNQRWHLVKVSTLILNWWIMCRMGCGRDNRSCEIRQKIGNGREFRRLIFTREALCLSRLITCPEPSAPATITAPASIIQLENTHGMRRGWPWAKYDWSPLARALEHLTALAESTKVSLAGQDLDALAKTYTQQSWRTDAPVLDALACVERSEDQTAVVPRSARSTNPGSRTVLVASGIWSQETGPKFAKPPRSILRKRRPIPTPRRIFPEAAQRLLPAVRRWASLRCGTTGAVGDRLSRLGDRNRIHHAVEIAELAIDKGADALLMPVSSRKQLFNLPDDLATKIDIQFYLDGKEALVKSLAD